MDVTEEDIRQFQQLQSYNRETIHGSLAVEIARISHILPEDSTSWLTLNECNVGIASDADFENLQKWKEQLEQQMRQQGDLTSHQTIHHPTQECDPHVIPFEQLLSTDLIDNDHTIKNGEEIKISLNEEQRRAYDIIDEHVQQTLEGRRPSQLRIIILGEGGTGKSHTIQAITTNFKRRKVKDWLVKGAYTGIAASIIDGSTLHVLTAMPIRGSRSAQTMKKLREFWKQRNILSSMRCPCYHENF